VVGVVGGGRALSHRQKIYIIFFKPILTDTSLRYC